jgi:hypothetical protein
VTDYGQLQLDLAQAHAERLREDAINRAGNRLQREAWEAKGGPKAEEEHFNWLRTLPKGKTDAGR